MEEDSPSILGVVIGPREMYEELRSLHDDVRILKDSFTSIPAELNEHKNRSNERYRDHEERIRKVEFKVWAAIGASGFLSAVIAVSIDLIARFT